MKKQLTNIETLKAMVNANVLECVELKQWSVQVYNLNEYEEYTNIYKVEKINGRYYMFDLADNKYMMCRQRDAEWFAGEFLHFVERERETVAAYVESIKKYGKTCINEAYYIPFTDALDAEGIEYRPIAGTLGYCNQGYVICCYEITSRPAEPQTTTEGENETETTNTPQDTENEPQSEPETTNKPQTTNTPQDTENEPQSATETTNKPTAHSVKRYELWADCRLLQDYTRKGDALNAWAKVCGKYNRAYVADVLDDYRHIVDTI